MCTRKCMLSVSTEESGAAEEDVGDGPFPVGSGRLFLERDGGALHDLCARLWTEGLRMVTR